MRAVEPSLPSQTGGLSADFPAARLLPHKLLLLVAGPAVQRPVARHLAAVPAVVGKTNISSSCPNSDYGLLITFN